MPTAGGAVDVVVRVSDRARRLLLRVARDGSGPVVVVPPGLKRDRVAAFVVAQAEWLQGRLAALPPRVPFVAGQVIPVAGEPLVLVQGGLRGRGIVRDGAQLVVPGDPGLMPRKVTRWLMAQAADTILPQRNAFADRLNRPVDRIRIADPRSRWGSCSSRGTMTFSWRLILAPPSVLTSVVAHECAHLVEMNHSARFWAVVATLWPTYPADDAWLKQHGAALFHYG